MDEFKKRLIHLHHCNGVGWTTIHQLLLKDPTLSTLYDHSFTLKPECNRIFAPHVPTFSQEAIEEILYQYSQYKIHVMTIFDPEYPSLLKEIYQPPWVLYLKGKTPLLRKNPKLAVVGSRTPSSYGEKVIKALFPGLIERGVLIVSGLAKGIDALSHQTAIQYGGNTIGIIAGGFFHLYPKENQKLAIEMMQNHLLISEYLPNSRPERWQFPARNRIISGITRGTLVIEAKSKSGSLITSNYAVNEGREVFAVPGEIFNHESVGTNELIQQGAKLVKNAQDILEELSY